MLYLGNGCRISMENYLSQVRLQAMTGTGPLSRMDDAELNCFARIACIHAHFEVRKILQASIEGFENQSIFEDASKTLQVESQNVRFQKHDRFGWNGACFLEDMKNVWITKLNHF